MPHAEWQVEAWAGNREANPTEVREALEKLHGREVGEEEIEYQEGGILLVSLPDRMVRRLEAEGFVEEAVTLADGTRVTVQAEMDR